MNTGNNIFLQGPHRPNAVEGVYEDLHVVGAIPPELSGIRHITSSNPQFEPIEADRYHWFEGDGMVCAISIENGRARAVTRWVETDGLMAERAAGRALYRPFICGSQPAPPPLDGPPIKHNANTNIIKVGERLLAFAELGLPFELDSESLATKGQFDFGSIQGPVTAHGKVDSDNGDLLFFAAVGPQITWYRADREGMLLETHAFMTGQLYMVHDFTVTQKYAIFFTSPTVFNAAGIMQGAPGLVWEDGVPATIWLLNRETREVQSIVLPDRFAVTHFLNAWHEGEEVVVHASRTEQWGPARSELHLPLRPGYFHPAFPWEWRINPATGAVSSRQISTVNSEFARHDPRLVGKSTRYGYYAATDTGTFGENALFDRVMKLDAKTGQAEFSKPDGLTAPGETIFVPRSDVDEEDAGWLMTPWWNEATDKTELVIEDAQQFGSGQPLARILLPFRLPPGFHGNWHPN